jgi:hypothetical protein
MHNDLQHIARERHVPMTIRRVPGGLLCWCSSEEDLRQARESASRLQKTQWERQAR